MNGVYSGSPLFTALKERGYLIDLYEDELYTQDENALSDFDNIIIANYHVNSWTGLAKQELKLVGFRYAPFDLKRFCVTKKSGFDEEILVDCGYKGFNSENYYFKGNLEDNEIVMDDTQKHFKFIHLALSMFAVSMILMTLGYVILLLIHPVVYRLGLAAGLLLLVCTYVQGNFLITNLPPLDGTNINWNDYLFLRRESLLLWGIVAVIVVMLLIFLKGRMFENVLMFISGCMTLMLLVTCVSLVISNPPQKESTQLYVTQKDEFTMSQN